ncbi:AAA family ATPase [Mesorhizobium australicum]|uniref:AAA family ATPase n=1 Tax=Mesorhizobium australicum TaxID=536018 RepID=UPI00333CF96C
MRLKSVFIGNYKNLKDFKLIFEGDEFIDIFVGRNGSGKSNFLEGLIAIFDHIYGYRADEQGPGFAYALVYVIDEREYKIEWQPFEFVGEGATGRLSINGGARIPLSRVPKPDNIIIYYSGQNAHIAALVERYEARFRTRIRNADLIEIPRFIGIGQAYKKLLILLLLLLPEETQSRRFLCEKLGILGNLGSFKLHLTRPFFATERGYDHLDPADLFWRAKGISRTFLDELISCIRGGATPGALHDRDADQYILEIDVEQFRRVFGRRQQDEIFRLFNNLKILGMLGDIVMTLTLAGIEVADLGQFSDGQFQSVYIFAISELFKNRNCITLLDEPDAFLHPEWQFDFLNQTHAISERAAKTNHILMTSHSAATLISDLDRSVKYFDLKEGKVNCYPLPKPVVIEKLSSKLIKYSEQEQILSIIHTIQFKKKPVFFTEGSVDPLILREAWKRLYQTEMPFIPFYAFSCTYLSQLLRDDRIFNEMGDMPVFGLFDLDEAYDQWKGIKGDEIQRDLVTGMIKRIENRSAYAILLPVPVNAKIRSQVMAPDGTCFGGKSLCEIEHLFYGDPKTDAFFESKPAMGGGTKIVIKNDKQKHKFASEVIPTLDDHYFEVFRPIFEFVRNTIAPVPTSKPLRAVARLVE